jgi:hypothetical protein
MLSCPAYLLDLLQQLVCLLEPRQVLWVLSQDQYVGVAMCCLHQVPPSGVNLQAATHNMLAGTKGSDAINVDFPGCAV